MKTRYGLISNSSSSSFMINTIVYIGIATIPATAAWLVYHNRNVMKDLIKFIKEKIFVKEG